MLQKLRLPTTWFWQQQPRGYGGHSSLRCVYEWMVHFGNPVFLLLCSPYIQTTPCTPSVLSVWAMNENMYDETEDENRGRKMNSNCCTGCKNPWRLQTSRFHDCAFKRFNHGNVASGHEIIITFSSVLIFQELEQLISLSSKHRSG